MHFRYLCLLSIFYLLLASPVFAACPAPQYPSQYNVTHQSVSVYWSYYGSGTPTYQVQWRSAGATGWNASPALTNSGYSITGLINNTTYEWRVRAICAVGDTSAFTNPLLFQTKCDKPTYVNTSNVTYQSARFNWGTSTSGSTYEVRWRAAGTTDWTVVSGLTDTRLIVTGLANNVTYEWQVRTLCSTTATSDFTSSELFQTMCATPSGLVTSRVTVDAAELRWESAAANARYDLQWRVVGGANWTMINNLDAPEYILTGLTNNTTYEWQVRRGCTTTEKSAFTPAQVFQTRCDVPTGLTTAAVTYNAAELNWSTATTGELRWRVAGTANWTTVPGATSPYRLTNLQTNTTYEWQVRAICAGGVPSDFTSSQLLTTRCTTPTGLSGYANETGGLSFYWYGSVGESFEVQWRMAGAPAWSAVTGISTTAYSLTGLTPNTDYEWRVRQVCSVSEMSDFALGQLVRTRCPIPQNPRAENVTNSGARLVWNDTDANGRYELQWRRVGAADWTSVPDLTTTTYSLTGLTSNVAYEWRVRKQCSTGTPADFTYANSFVPRCNQPNYASGYALSPTSVSLNWYGIDIYPPYELQWRPLGATDWTIVSNLQATSYTLTGLTNNALYEWRVRSSCPTGGPTDFASMQTVQTHCGQSAQNMQVQNVRPDQVELYWQSSGSTPYEIQYREAGSADWITVRTETGVVGPYYGSNASFEKRYPLYRLVPGRTYAWRMRAVCEAGFYGEYTDGPAFTTACRVPSNVAGYTPNGTTLSITWSNEPLATSYQLQWRAAGAADWNSIDNLTESTYQLTSLTPGNSYEYRVQQTCSADTRSDFSVVQTTAMPCWGPQSLNVRPLSATGAQLAWFAYTPGDAEVQYRIGGSADWTTLLVPFGSTESGTGGSTYRTYSLTALSAGGQYEFRVRTVCGPGVTSTYSDLVTAQLGCPLPATPSIAVGVTSARLIWQGPYGPPAYRVQWRVEGSANWTSATVTNEGSNGPIYTLADLLPNTTYEWRVAGDCGGNDQSAYLPTQTFQTSCPVIAYVYADGTSATQARLSWTTSTWSSLFSGTYTLQYRPAGTVVWTEVNGLTTSSVSLTGLTTNVTYECRVRANCGSGGVAAYSSITSFRTLCNYPGNITTTVTQQRATISWTTGLGDPLPVNLQWRAQNVTDWIDVPNLTESYSFSGLVPNTTYLVRLQTVCSATERSAYMPYPIAFTTYTFPIDLSVYVNTISAHTARLSRSNPFDGKSYVFQWRVQNTSAWATTGPVTAVNYLLTSLTANTTYEVRVGAVEPGGVITYSPVSTFQTYCAQPGSLNAVNVTTASAQLTWSGTDLPTTVQWRMGGAADWTTVAGVIGNSYSLTGLANSTTYEWRVQTNCSSEAASAFVYGLIFRTLCRMPGSPATQAVTTNSARLFWNSPGPGSSFTVRYRSVGAPAWTTVTGLTSASYVLTNLVNNTTYEWGVANACGSDGSTAYTASVQFTTRCALPTDLYVNAVTTDRAVLSWSGTGPTYQLDWRKLGSSNWSSVSNATSPYTLMGLANNETYEWRVRSGCSVATNGPFATGYTFVTRCSFDLYNSEQTLNISSQSARLSWSTQSVTNYRLRWRAVGSTTWTVVSSNVMSPYVLTGLTNNTVYEWQLGTDCQTSYASLQTFQTRCKPPGNLRIDARTTTSAQLRWDDSGEGVGYELQWRVAGSTTWNTVSNLTGASYTLTNLTNKTSYEWQVRSQCANGSAFETTVVFTTADDCALGLYTVRAGSWDDPAVWSCSRVPTATERVHVRHGVTMPGGYTAHARAVQYESGGVVTFGTGARLRLGQ